MVIYTAYKIYTKIVPDAINDLLNLTLVAVIPAYSDAKPVCRQYPYQPSSNA